METGLYFPKQCGIVSHQ